MLLISPQFKNNQEKVYWGIHKFVCCTSVIHIKGLQYQLRNQEDYITAALCARDFIFTLSIIIAWCEGHTLGSVVSTAIHVIVST
jgi:hypothetical protein